MLLSWLMETNEGHTDYIQLKRSGTGKSELVSMKTENCPQRAEYNSNSRCNSVTISCLLELGQCCIYNIHVRILHIRPVSRQNLIYIYTHEV